MNIVKYIMLTVLLFVSCAASPRERIGKIFGVEIKESYSQAEIAKALSASIADKKVGKKEIIIYARSEIARDNLLGYVTDNQEKAKLSIQVGVVSGENIEYLVAVLVYDKDCHINNVRVYEGTTPNK